MSRSTPPADPSPLDRAGLRLVAGLLLAGGMLAPGATETARPPGRLPLALCFAPGTPDSYRAEVECKAATATAEIAAYQASPSNRWSATAYDGTNGTRGAPTRLTWGVVPDGTAIGGFSGEAAAPSNLRSFLNGLYGNQSTWMAVLQQVFDSWGDASGITFIHEPNDDGVPLGNTAGSRGVRPDIRIGGHRIDGNTGTLAYAFFPNRSDVVIDTSDSYFRTTSQGSRRLRNTLAHEVGHGLGFNHVCPQNRTKLMEPASGDAFDGPQLDDILAVQRLYGDRHEPNDVPGNATGLGTPGTSPVRVEGVSIDGTSDEDLFAFDAPVGSAATVVVRPVGETYLQGAQRANGACTSGTAFDALARVDLRVRLLAPDRSTVLAVADAAPAGESESLVDIPLSSGAGVYYVEVDGSGVDDVQLYRLDLSLALSSDIPIAARDVLVIDEDTEVDIAVLANDAGVDTAPVRVRLTNDPEHGRAFANDDGTISYRPDRDYVGSDDFAYEVRNATGRTSEADVVVIVDASPRAGLAKIDSDEDQYPDELEDLLGTVADDAASRPAAAPPGPLLVTRARIALRFHRDGRDKVGLRAAVPVPAGFDPAGATLMMYVGGVFRTFVLDAKGRGGDGDTEKVRLRVKRAKDGSVPAQQARLDVVLRRLTLSPAFADEGLTPDARPRRGYRETTVFLLTGGGARENTLPLNLRVAKSRRRGVAKLLRD